MSGQFRNLHPYVSQRLIAMFESLAKKHSRLIGTLHNVGEIEGKEKWKESGMDWLWKPLQDRRWSAIGNEIVSVISLTKERTTVPRQWCRLIYCCTLNNITRLGFCHKRGRASHSVETQFWGWADSSLGLSVLTHDYNSSLFRHRKREWERESLGLLSPDSKWSDLSLVIRHY